MSIDASFTPPKSAEEKVWEFDQYRRAFIAKGCPAVESLSISELDARLEAHKKGWQESSVEQTMLALRRAIFVISSSVTDSQIQLALSKINEAHETLGHSPTATDPITGEVHASIFAFPAFDETTGTYVATSLAGSEEDLGFVESNGLLYPHRKFCIGPVETGPSSAIMMVTNVYYVFDSSNSEAPTHPPIGNQCPNEDPTKRARQIDFAELTSSSPLAREAVGEVIFFHSVLASYGKYICPTVPPAEPEDSSKPSGSE